MEKNEAVDLRSLREKAEKPAVPVVEEAEEALVSREETFRVAYRAPDGTKRETALVSRILDSDERHVVARMCALMSNGIPFDNLPRSAQARFYALAVCNVQLREAPDWLEKWLGIDDELLDALFVTLEGHESRYFRRDLFESEKEEGIPRVAVSPVVAS
jgi:hypothetical protein